MKTSVVLSIVLVGLLSSTFAQEKKQPETRHPAINAEASPRTAPKPDGDFFSIANGLPMLLELHHDTEVGTGNPIDVYMFVIEMQVMNSDGNFEPVGLQIHHYYTAKAVDPNHAFNPHNARDCKVWNSIINYELSRHTSKSVTWPYVQFITAQGARVIQTNEDGAVWWSDDIECWGSKDRFPPF